MEIKAYTVSQAISTVKNELSSCTDAANPLSEAKEIICFVLRIDKSELYKKYEEKIAENLIADIDSMIKRRLALEPLQYIIGKWEFMSLPFYTGPGVLIPREDTECIVRIADNIIKSQNKKSVLDLCAGTGACGLSLAYFNQINCALAEKYDEALFYLKKNLDNLKLKDKCKIIKDDILKKEYSYAKYDIIISNPPYIKKEEYDKLDLSVKNYEPSSALIAEDDGLAFYKFIAENFKKHLNPGGFIIFEVGYDQALSVAGILKQNNYLNIETAKDINGNSRAVFAQI